MKISVVIPVYNGEKYLKECINSVLNQPYKDIEIIAINDGSKDNSVDILNKVAQTDKRLNVIDQKNHGVAYTRNKGIDIATGNYIVFLDQDDMWVTDFLTEDVINEIKQEKCDMVSFKKGDNAFVDYLVFKEKKPEPMKLFPHMAVYGKKLKKPQVWTDVRGEVISDYQTACESDFVRRLRDKYKVEIYEEVLNTVNNH